MSESTAKLARLMAWRQGIAKGTPCPLTVRDLIRFKKAHYAAHPEARPPNRYQANLAAAHVNAGYK